tara:strand:- start:1861 stop:3303 length:1443 start_codon:yes stop_codon:yes gene_type:complete
MAGKTYPQLDAAATPVVDTDVMAVYRSPGPLKQTPLSELYSYIKTFFEASGGSALVGFIASAAGAIATTLQARGRKVIYASDFGVTGDGTDEASKMRSAIAAAAGKSLYVPNPTGTFILCNSSLGTIPQKTRIFGESKRGTVIRAGFGSGTLMTLADGVELENLALDGNSQACKGVEILGTAGNQSMTEVRIINFANDCIYFEKNAGSGFNAVGLEAFRSDGASGSGNYAIRIEDASGGLGPKHFFGLETGGRCAFSFGGANNVYVVGSTLADCLFSANNQSVHIIGCRIANATTMTLLGSSVSIVGGNVNPQIILGSGVQSCFIAPAAANNGILDSSGVATNQIFDGVTQVYTPVLTTSGGSVTIGDGDISGSYCRTGTQIAGSINFTVGASTVFNGGGGTLRFSIPFTPTSISLQRQVQAEIIDATTPAAPYMCGGLVQSTFNYLTLIRDTTGLVTSASPIAVPAAGDTYRLSFLYNL